MSPAAVSFLVPDIHSPVLGPVTVLASHLIPDYEVEIVGPDFGHGVCPMYRDAFPYKVISCPRIYRWPDYFWESRHLAAALTGHVIVAVKAFATSLPVALQARRRRQAKVIAYLDEWDGALMARLSPTQKMMRWIKHVHHPVDDIYCPWVERLLPRCDHVLSTTTALQKRFGGAVLPMGVDLDVFSPRPKEESIRLRRELDLKDRNLIVFGGVVRPHKGIELILDSLAAIGNPSNALVIVGPVNEHVAALGANPAYAPYLVAIGPRPKADMPNYLGLADLVVLPLNDDLLAQTQMPCKVFEAMAMAKPIIASAVSDLPLVLEGCGWTVPPDDAGRLARCIQWAFTHPEEAASQGQRARQKCMAQYSRQVVSSQLHAIIGKLTNSL
ncbi:MAG TPA: glycosyltransferase [Kiritimatiellia bacterium]|nr:glycosyltransferase [Kiritimatiellia bacterium]